MNQVNFSCQVMPVNTKDVHIEVLEIELMTLHKDIRTGMSSPLKKQERCP